MAKLLKQLGKKRDTDLAREFGVSRQRIGQMREKYGIEAFADEPNMPYPIPVTFSVKDETDMKAAMGKTGESNRCNYIRKAVREKNKKILEGGQ